MKSQQKKYKIKWMDKPEDHNYPAAESYLSLIFTDNEVKRIAKSLKSKKISHFKAKDIFRASKLSLLGVSNTHVNSNHRKIRSGQKLSPILLVRDQKNRTVIVADGYHRLCSVYHFDENALIPVKITNN